MTPLVTAILPLYNGERYLREALDSIFQQTYRPLEVIVIDDGSTDNSALLLQHYPDILYLKQDNQGNARARNRGVQMAKGEWIAFLDQDDLWMPDKIQRQVNACQADPSIQYVVGKSRYFINDQNPPPPYFKQSLLHTDQVSYLPGVLMAKKELLQQFPFDARYQHGSDTDWCIRVREQHVPFAILPEVLLRVRIHAENLSHDTARHYGELLSMLKQSIQRKEPLISIIVPVYNGEKYLKEALDSILAQNVRPLEIIVVDDGSTDKTKEVAERFGEQIRYIYQENGGIGAARNQGVSLASGTYLAFLDADDLWTESKLSQQLELFRNNPTLDMAFGEALHFFSPDFDPLSQAKYKLPPSMRSTFASTMLIKRSSFEKVGPFSTSVQVGEFVDWYCRAKEIHLSEESLPAIILKRRVHGDNTTLKKKNNQADYLRILHQSLQRRNTSV